MAPSVGARQDVPGDGSLLLSLLVAACLLRILDRYSSISKHLVSKMLTNFLDADRLLVCGVAWVLRVAEGAEVPVRSLCVVLM
jgi:hypothetical protein